MMKLFRPYNVGGSYLDDQINRKRFFPVERGEYGK